MDDFEFISAGNCPAGVAYISRAGDKDAVVSAARAALNDPATPGVVIERNYPDLTAAANRVFAHLNALPAAAYGITGSVYKAGRTPRFADNAVGRDLLSIMGAFNELRFRSLNLIASETGDIYAHTDGTPDGSEKTFDHLGRGLLSGGVNFILPAAKTGTGLYDADALEAIGALPVYADGKWEFENEDYPGLAAIAPRYTRPGDLVILRRENWPATHPPCVHTVPLSNQGSIDRPAYIATGYVRDMTPR